DDEVREFLRSFKTGTTLQRHKAAIKRYFIYKRRLWLFDSKEFIPARRRLPKYHRRELVEQLIAVAREGHDRMFVKTLFMGGLRIAELMSLTCDSIEPNGIRLVGKGDRERIVPIADRDYMGELRAYVAGVRGKLFPGKYWDYWLLLRRLCLEAGVEMVSPHSLRHSRAVDLIQRGVSLGGLQTFLGHQDPATTLIYTQLTQEDLARELDKAEG
ncbi:unnamed protein product, partial [marine sediment metagenome]